jgi:ATP-dependent protease ClpP protease subunit
MKSKTAYALKERTSNVGAPSLQLEVYDIIGDFWAGGDGNTTARIVAEQLKANRSASEIHVRINSLGGILDDALAIRAQLIDHPAIVTIDIDGVAASAATVIMAGGNKIRIGAPCAVMIHEARSGIRGASEADYLARAAELRIANDGLAEIYAAMAKARGKATSKDDFRALMAKESWFSAQEAVDIGLADEVIAAVPDALVAQVDLSDCRAIPGWVAERFAASPMPVVAAAKTAASGAVVPAPTQGSNPMKFIAVLAMLGITEATDEATAMATAKRLKESGEVAGKLEALTGESGPTALVTASAWKQRVTNLETDLASARAEAATAKAEADKARADADSSEHKAIIDRLVNEGRLTGEEKIAKAKAKSLAELKDLAEFLPVSLPGDPASALRQAGGDAVTLTEAEKKDAASMGMSEDDYLTAKKNVKRKYG